MTEVKAVEADCGTKAVAKKELVPGVAEQKATEQKVLENLGLAAVKPALKPVVAAAAVGNRAGDTMGTCK